MLQQDIIDKYVNYLANNIAGSPAIASLDDILKPSDSNEKTVNYSKKKNKKRKNRRRR